MRMFQSSIPGPPGEQGVQGLQGDPGPPGAGEPVAISKDGSSVVAEVSRINFIGGGVLVADAGAGVADVTILLAQGEQGPPGPQGPQGEQGEPGTSGVDVGLAWPVGSVFISVVSTNPATLLGIGTWDAFATGRMLVGFDAGQTEFDTVEETGGEKTHTLTTAEMPAHTHTYTQPDEPTLDIGPIPTSTVVRSRTAGVATGSTGGGGAHNNLPPYIVVYMWKRTS